MHAKPRIAWLWPEFGLIDGDVIHLAEQRGAEAFIFRVGAESNADDPSLSSQRPENLANAVISMGKVDTLSKVAATAKAVNADVVAWGCTSGSFMGEPGSHLRQVEAMRAVSGVPATSTSVAILHALKKNDMKRVCVITPYPALVGDRFIQFLMSNQIDVLKYGHIGRMNDEGISALTLEDFIPFARQTWVDGAEGWVLPCTAVRLTGLVDWFEREYGKPVVAANSATLDHAVELAREAALTPA